MKVPLGTVVGDVVTGTLLSDLQEEGEVCVLAQGGEGGVGNAAFATASCRRTRECTLGDPGQEREIELELKTIADVGMVRNVHHLLFYVELSVLTAQEMPTMIAVMYSYMNFKVSAGQTFYPNLSCKSKHTWRNSCALCC